MVRASWPEWADRPGLRRPGALGPQLDACATAPAPACSSGAAPASETLDQHHGGDLRGELLQRHLRRELRWAGACAMRRGASMQLHHRAPYRRPLPLPPKELRGGVHLPARRRAPHRQHRWRGGWSNHLLGLHVVYCCTRSRQSQALAPRAPEIV